MASWRWTKEGMLKLWSGSDGITGQLANDSTAALVTDSPLTFDWLADRDTYTKASGSGLDPIVVKTAWTGPWVDPDKQCVYEKNPNITFTNGTEAPVTVTGLEIYEAGLDGVLWGVLVFDDEEVLNPGDAIEIDLFAGTGTCNPDATVIVMEV